MEYLYTENDEEENKKYAFAYPLKVWNLNT